MKKKKRKRKIKCIKDSYKNNGLNERREREKKKKDIALSLDF
jgi:hypothetical protein